MIFKYMIVLAVIIIYVQIFNVRGLCYSCSANEPSVLLCTQYEQKQKKHSLGTVSLTRCMLDINKYSNNYRKKIKTCKNDD